MKRSAQLLVLLLACLPTLLYAQNDESKYLAGAVPVVDGKVVFSKKFDLPGAAQDAIYDRVYSWLETKMKENKNSSRIVYSDKEKGMIAAMGEEYIVFSSSALSLDRTVVNYQITATCQPNSCLLEIERIRYTYQEKEKYTAEEYITDEIALNKAKTSIYRGYKKFRIKTVDFANEIFDQAREAFGLPKTATPVAATVVTQPPLVTNVSQPVTDAVTSATKVAEPTPVPAVQPEVRTIPAATLTPATVSDNSMQGYKRIDADKIPGNIIKMLGEDWMLITAGNDQEFNMMTASWGGLGRLYEKPVAMCFINPTRYTYQLMEKNDTYTFTFYTEAYRDALKFNGSNSGRNTDKVKGSNLTPITTPQGSKAFSEAWLIIECRKLVAQSLTPEAISNQEVKQEWSGKQLHKMFIGEIINVWVK